jgi:hypothetical protein
VNKICLVRLSCCTQDKVASIFVQTVGFPLLNRAILIKSLDLSQGTTYTIYTMKIGDPVGLRRQLGVVIGVVTGVEL